MTFTVDDRSYTVMENDFTSNVAEEFNHTFGDIVQLFYGDTATFEAQVPRCFRVLIQHDGFKSNPPEMLDVGEDFNESYSYSSESGTISFNLEGTACKPSQPHTFNFEQGLWELDAFKNYRIYLKQDGEILDLPAKLYDDIDSPGKVLLTVSDLLTNLRGFHTSNDSEIDLNPSTCKTYQYEGTYYVRQLVQTWENYHVIGSFYVEKDGVKEYLQGSQRSFQHKGSQLTLKEVLEPYYQSVATFLRSFGVDATYDPNFWGSYNSGGVKVIRNTEDNIKFGSETGYDLLFDGYSDAVCTSYKSFEELENGPATVTISANTFGDPMLNEITILCSHEPEDPSDINLMQYFGFNEDIVLKSCFGEVPS